MCVDGRRWGAALPPRGDPRRRGNRSPASARLRLFERASIQNYNPAVESDCARAAPAGKVKIGIHKVTSEKVAVKIVQKGAPPSAWTARRDCVHQPLLRRKRVLRSALRFARRARGREAAAAAAEGGPRVPDTGVVRPPQRAQVHRALRERSPTVRTPLRLPRSR